MKRRAVAGDVCFAIFADANRDRAGDLTGTRDEGTMRSSDETLETRLASRLGKLAADETIRRLWNRDPSVWGGDAETPELSDRLGWLDVGTSVTGQLVLLGTFADEVRQQFDRVVLLGMGGSSLAPEVLWRTFGWQDGYPALHMLDSTVPQAVLSVDGGGDLDGTLFIVASKSGTTLETMSFFRHFWKRAGGNGAQFVAITDPGTSLERLGSEKRFRRVFLNPPDIGGRYSALSLFGLVPAALMGIEVDTLLERAQAMARRCGPDVPVEDNPGTVLGATMAEAAMVSRDKLSFVLSHGMGSFGLWIEQLVAESTGKNGKGIIPVACEPPEARPRFCTDRLFVGMSLEGERSGAIDRRLQAIDAEGSPLTRIELADPYDLGAEFFRWEFATAVAGAVLGVNPFDQPNVAESKENTTRVLAAGGSAAGHAGPRRSRVVSLLDGVEEGDYVNVQAFLPPTEENDERLASLCAALRDRVDAAVTLGYGPRYLHSTGQLHKGGPKTGHFVQVVVPVEQDLEIPGADYGFGRLMAAQAQGDYEALVARKRPIIRVSDPTDLLELM